MNRVKLTIKSEDDQRTLCKIGTSIDPSAGEEYSDLELAAVLTDMAVQLTNRHRLWDKWAAVLNAESSSNAKAILLESQEAKYEM